MDELKSSRIPAGGFSRSLALWAQRRVLWLAEHWLAVVNGFFLLYVGLPFLAPVLLAGGYTGAANMIYMIYRAACHQIPSRSYFILGEQVAFCHRDVAIYGTLLVGGLVYGLVRNRLPRLELRWYVFFMAPMAVDAGLALFSGWPFPILWAMGLIAWGITSAILHSQRYLTWHSYLFFIIGPLSLIYLYFVGSHSSNLFLRNLTGFIFGIGTVWFVYPYLEDTFAEMRERVGAKLNKASS